MTEKLKMKVWMTKYALTGGVKAIWVERPRPDEKFVYTIPKGDFEYRIQLKLGSTAFERWQDALTNAQKQRDRKIQSLKKKIKELEGMQFSGTP